MARAGWLPRRLPPAGGAAVVPPACGWGFGVGSLCTPAPCLSLPLQIARVQSLQRGGLIELDAKSVKEVLVGKSRPYSVFIIAGAGGG